MKIVAVYILFTMTAAGLAGAEEPTRCKYCDSELELLDAEKTIIEFDGGFVCPYPECGAVYVDGVWYTREQWNNLVEKALTETAKSIDKEIEEQVKINRENRRENRIRELVENYNWSRKRAERVTEGYIYIGDTPEIVREAWGTPADINRTITGYGTYEQWVYGSGCYVYFENGMVTAIQD